MTFVGFDVSTHIDLLREGENLLAIHGLNAGNGSSDFLVWPALDGITIAGGQPTSIHPSAIEYTGPIVFTESTVVKARILEGQSWSPIARAEFVVDAVPARAGSVAISRIHYHPAEPGPAEIDAGFTSRGLFEFLELLNIGDQAVDLAGTEFVEGLRFRFTPGTPGRILAPNERIRLVANESAYGSRHGTGAVIAGEFENSTRLANEGEHLVWLATDQSVLVDLTYDDESPWPIAADGDGYSLALIDPGSRPDPSDPRSWATVREAGTDGGHADPIADWFTRHFTTAELENPAISGWTADPDGDRISNALELFHGTHPRTKNGHERGLTIRAGGAGDGSLHLEFARAAEYPMLTLILRTSTDLSNWVHTESGARKSVSTSNQAIQIQTIQVPIDPTGDVRFYQLEVTMPAR